MIGLISAIDTELKPYLNAITDKKSHQHSGREFFTGKLLGKDVVCATCGVGKVNAALTAYIMADKFGVDSIIFSGTGGGMKEKQHIGDVIIVSESTYHDCDIIWLKNYYPNMPTDRFAADERLLELARKASKAVDFTVHEGLAVTGDRFITDDGRDLIKHSFSPESVDMETAGAAQTCFSCKVPFLAIRALSDTEADRGLGTFEENCAMASENAFKLVSEMFKGL